MDLETKYGKLRINLIWLRDNCRCEHCYDFESHQRKWNKIDLKNSIFSNYELRDDFLYVTWIDGHESKYHVEWLKDQLSREKGPPVILWSDDDDDAEIDCILPSSDLKCEDNQKEILKALLERGVAMISGVGPDINSTKEAVVNIAPVMPTIFSRERQDGMWSTNADNYETYRDTAYETTFLAPHTDNTYFHEAGGVMAFHCIEKAEKGGETLLVDGYKVAEKLRARNKAHFDCLTEISVESQFITKDKYFTCVGFVINLHPNSDQIKQIRYNIYDRSARAPFSSRHNFNLFYESLSHFKDITGEAGMKKEILLQPGKVLLVNNWRVLHGRREFSGKRSVVGCYISMADLLSRARLLRLIL